MKIQYPGTVSNLQSWEELRRFCSLSFDAIASAVNGNISFQDNLDVQALDFLFEGTIGEVGIQHNLGRVPFGYIVVTRNNPVTIYDGTSDNTSETIYLRSTGQAKAKVIIF